ncbi:uncharacterized protein LTR77_003276 [Saxophila tyrrhenica]|uniref:Uncharacterized protein n=1 Tax=Saxophila tyrrhenica TaxID=1690608 RepID=A0AAV9PHD3_9PEZI|nr:hypothetical protein LTR77_003276 [Saxophila tyrrhenica]
MPHTGHHGWRENIFVGSSSVARSKSSAITLTTTHLRQVNMLRSLSIFTSLALSTLAASTNLTISFNTPGDAGCGAKDSSNALTFTTGSIPPSRQCFNIEELFRGNESQSQGSRIEHSAGSSEPYEAILWVVYKANQFRPGLNYSQISYLQRNTSSPEEGKDAARLFEVYSGRDCIASDSSDGSVHPWFGWTCQGPIDGSCSTVPYSVASFQVGSAWEINSRGGGQCWDAALKGAAAGRDRVAVNAAIVAILAAAITSLLL